MLRHIPVLASEIYNHMPTERTLSFDGTFGHGGHAEYFLTQEQARRSLTDLKIIGTDIDTAMIAKACSLTSHFQDNISVLHSSYARINEISKDI